MCIVQYLQRTCVYVYYTCPVHVGQLTQQILDMTPDKRDLLEVLAEIKHMWYPVGEMLGVGRADLEGLHSSNRPDNERLSATLQYWMDTKPSPVTWGTILKVLRSDYIGQPRVADKIQHKLSLQKKSYQDLSGKGKTSCTLT